jgi:hypothetical protein
MIEQVLPQWEPLLRHTDDAIRRSATNTLSVHVCTPTPNAPNAAQVRLLQVHTASFRIRKRRMTHAVYTFNHHRHHHRGR